MVSFFYWCHAVHMRKTFIVIVSSLSLMALAITATQECTLGGGTNLQYLTWVARWDLYLIASNQLSEATCPCTWQRINSSWFLKMHNLKGTTTSNIKRSLGKPDNVWSKDSYDVWCYGKPSIALCIEDGRCVSAEPLITIIH